MEKINSVVIGAGVVGLALARELAIAGHETLIIESQSAIGTQTSSRNSEVIHAGISYPANTLKAKLCVSGKQMLYQYCQERGIAHRQIGKLIVATEESEIEALYKYLKQGQAAGVDDLQMLAQDEIARIEPAIKGIAAIFSPSTGIVDSHGLMLTLLGDAENAGATLSLNSKVVGGEISDDAVVLQVSSGSEIIEIACQNVFNCGGLYAQAIAHLIKHYPISNIPPIHYAIGRYYTMKGKSPFHHLVYPVSREASLRVHVTMDLGGQCKFGPDLEWIDHVDYQFKKGAETAFYAGIRRYYPDLPDNSLQEGYIGIRPRLAGPNDPLHSGAVDFQILRHQCGQTNFVNLFGIESPGLTSSLAIGKYTKSLLSN